MLHKGTKQTFEFYLIIPLFGNIVILNNYRGGSLKTLLYFLNRAIILYFQKYFIVVFHMFEWKVNLQNSQNYLKLF